MNIISSIPILNYFFNPDKRILGEDSRHKTWNKCYIPIHFIFQNNVPNIYERFKVIMTKDLKNSESRFRLTKNGKKNYTPFSKNFWTPSKRTFTRCF